MGGDDMFVTMMDSVFSVPPVFDDSWKDIAGYATLIVNELNGDAK